MIGRGEGVAVIDAAREDVFRNNAGRCDLTVHWPRRILLRALLAAALALPAANAFAQSPLSPKISLQGDQKRGLTPSTRRQPVKSPIRSVPILGPMYGRRRLLRRRRRSSNKYCSAHR